MDRRRGRSRRCSQTQPQAQMQLRRCAASDARSRQSCSDCRINTNRVERRGTPSESADVVQDVVQIACGDDLVNLSRRVSLLVRRVMGFTRCSVPPGRGEARRLHELGFCEPAKCPLCGASIYAPPGWGHQRSHHSGPVRASLQRPNYGICTSAGSHSTG